MNNPIKDEDGFYYFIVYCYFDKFNNSVDSITFRVCDNKDVEKLVKFAFTELLDIMKKLHIVGKTEVNIHDKTTGLVYKSVKIPKDAEYSKLVNYREDHDYSQKDEEVIVWE